MHCHLKDYMKTIPSAVLLLIASLAGCGTVADIMPSEGNVLTISPGTFSVSVSDLDSTVSTRVALVKAQDYCASRSTQMFVTNIKDDTRLESIGRRGSSTVTFQCLTKDQRNQALEKEDRSK